MKKLFIPALFALAFSVNATAQNANKMIRQTVETFVKGGDERDVEMLNTAMDDNFRAVVNNTEGQPLMVLDKTAYIGLIEGGKIGGDKRSVSFESVDVYNNVNATVKAKVTGEKAVFYGYYSLVNTTHGWRLVQDLVYMMPK